MATIGIEQHLADTRVEESPDHVLKGDFTSLVSAVEAAADFITVVVSAFVARHLYESFPVGRHICYSAGSVWGMSLVMAVAVIFLLNHEGEYEWGDSLLNIRETERVLRVAIQAGLLLFALSFLLAHPFSRVFAVIAIFALASGLIVQKQALRFVIQVLHKKGYGLQRVLIYGAGYTGRRVASTLLRSEKLGVVPVGIVDDSSSMAGREIANTGYSHRTKLTVQKGPLTRDMIRASGAETVIVAIPKLGMDKIKGISAETEACGVRLAFIPNDADSDTWLHFTNIDGVVLSFRGIPRAPIGYEIFKRVLDFSISLMALICLGPILLVIAALVKMDSPGPALFSQERIGKNGERFHILKFRTMYTDAPRYGYSPSMSSDSRITKMGAWLRRTSFDEFPQLLNVLKGEMALVGPRPEMPFIVERFYGARERRRLAVLPGITGLWQLSADRAFQIHENLYYDLYYIRNRSFFMDVAVLLHTFAFAMRGV